MTITMPSRVEYGYITGRIILAVADSDDPDKYPDAVPATGQVMFTPKGGEVRLGQPNPALVIRQPILATIDAQGYLMSPTGNYVGLWLVTGVYNVTYKLPSAAVTSHDIKVEATHTETDPLDLTTAIPPSGVEPTPSQFSELASRIETKLDADRLVPLSYGQVTTPAERPTHRTLTAETSQSAQPPVAGFGWGDIDEFSFIVPPSGGVVVTLNATTRVNNNGTLTWGLWEGGGLVDSVTATKSGTPAPVTTRSRVTTRGDGTPLVPGERVTMQWRHRTTDGDGGSTIYGGATGAAVIEVTPLSDRLTERDVAATLTATPDYNPLWMTTDGTLVGQTGSTIGWSTDEGETWTAAHEFPTAAVQQVREVSGGEIVVFTGWGKFQSDPYRRIGIWRSHGWADDPATATWTHVHSGTGPDVETAGGNWGAWGVDAFGDVVVANEYGPKSGADVSMARYTYLSEDAGLTWRVCFDLAEMVTPNAGAHLHGVCYDPWWDAIWVVNGDGDGTSKTHVSFDRGKTWRDLYQDHQFTSVYALPECILFVTDEGDPNGVFRIPRTHPNSLRWEVAYIDDPRPNPALTIIGKTMFRSATRPGAPLLIACGVGSATGGGKIIATYDGWTFTEVWSDEGQTYQNEGVAGVFGPTSTGRYVGLLTRPGERHQITLELD